MDGRGGEFCVRHFDRASQAPGADSSGLHLPRRARHRQPVHPASYVNDLLQQMEMIGIGSLPIVLLTGAFIGAVMVLQTASQFERFGETSLTGDVVSLALVRELGPTITGLLVAGRNASGMASELGSMQVTEQVDAMRAMGTDPNRKLVAPRVLATMFVLPLLTAMADFVGLTGGFIVSYFTLRIGAVDI